MTNKTAAQRNADSMARQELTALALEGCETLAEIRTAVEAARRNGLEIDQLILRARINEIVDRTIGV